MFMRSEETVMTLAEFVRENRTRIDNIIHGAYPADRMKIQDDDERELWVLNDEYLYEWATSEGVEL